MKKILLLLAFFLAVSCRNIDDCNPTEGLDFNADSAYEYIRKQVSFGPRVPNTMAHDSCALFLENKLKKFGGKVYIQKADVRRYDSTILHITNIIAEFYPEKKRRVMLFTHWDSRFYADGEPDSVDRNHAIPGANDGASGVAILLEIARQITKKEPEVGVDIMLFDAEDQGPPITNKIFDEKTWCLGSQYWTKHPHRQDYKAFQGIEIDLAGAANAKFCREDNSRYFDNFTVKRLWKFAAELGYSDYFCDNLASAIINDHVFVNQNAHISSILIVDNGRPGRIPFFKEWHTSRDDMSVIDKKTLKVVGNVVMQYVYCLK